jgi:dipicolinate synthase subunit A
MRKGGKKVGNDLQGICIAVLGGDRRNIYLISELAGQKARVKAFGFLPAPELASAELVTSLEAALAGVKVVIMPMQGTDQDGMIKTLDQSVYLQLTADTATLIKPGTLVVTGAARDFLKRWASIYQWQLVEIGEMDDLAIYNAVPSAEGALQLAMGKLPITLHGSQSFVLGYGRLARTLARMLMGLGAHATVVARKPQDLARIWETGARPVPFVDLESHIAEAEIIFNTVPVLVLTEALLARMRRDVLIIDLASAPGGTDFAAARALGRQALLAPGLPGSVAPKTSGQILARVIPQLILSKISVNNLQGEG